MSVATDVDSISVRLSGALCDYCGSPRALTLPASAAKSVRAVLAQLEQCHESLYRSVCDETGAVRQHIGVFVNEAHIRDREGVDTPLRPGDTLTILPAVSGG
jgi:molybdopterin converting factor small subunit